MGGYDITNTLTDKRQNTVLNWSFWLISCRAREEQNRSLIFICLYSKERES